MFKIDSTRLVSRTAQSTEKQAQAVPAVSPTVSTPPRSNTPVTPSLCVTEASSGCDREIEPGETHLEFSSCSDLAATLAIAGIRPALVHADPPWAYSNRQNGSSARAYGCLSMDDIAQHLTEAFEVAATDSYLLLWSTLPLARVWARVETPWEYKSAGVWVKRKKLGVGYHWRGQVEKLELYVKGSPAPFRRNLRNCFVDEEEPVYFGEAEQHSVKPVIWQKDLIETFAPVGGAVLDMYAGLAGLAKVTAPSGRHYYGAEVDFDRWITATENLQRAGVL